MHPVHFTDIEKAGYCLAEKIGSGGMGDVYRAHHLTLQRVAAIKVLYRKEMAGRFKNEAYIQSSVSHPNITRLYDYVLSGNTPCIIMEYVEGHSLDAYIRKKGKLGNEETKKILRQIVSALAYLHGKGIVHRDIKPQNFKIQSDGTVKMLDFGIAKNKYTPKFTQQGFVVGTAEYMAPEQFQQQVEKKSDMWSLGVMTYEMLTGHMPFEAINPVSLRLKIIKSDFTDPKILVPDISCTLARFIDKSLRCNPGQRISAAETEVLLQEKSSKPAAHNRQWRIPGILRSRPMQLAMLLVIAIILLVISFSGSSSRQKGNEGPAGPGINPPGKLEKIKINVPSIENAEIIFSNGRRYSIPYEITGKEGEVVEFTLHARGYRDKKVQVEFTPRRSSYEYNLEKIKQE